MVPFLTPDAIILRHCQVLLDFEVLERWGHELSQMNLDKVGEPYYYPDSFIELLGYIRAYFHLSYRNLPYEEMGINLERSPHYSTISRRINKLKIGINKKLGNDIVIALDSTGIKLTNKEEWMHHKWHVRKGYRKIHITQKPRAHEMRLHGISYYEYPFVPYPGRKYRKSSIFLDITSEEVHNGK
jgi:hypothetical protein